MEQNSKKRSYWGELLPELGGTIAPKPAEIPSLIATREVRQAQITL